MKEPLKTHILFLRRQSRNILAMLSAGTDEQNLDLKIDALRQAVLKVLFIKI